MEDQPMILSHNFTVVLTEEDDIRIDNRDEKYEQFLADVWVGVVLTLMVLSCVCCVCSCLLYHKFQQWKRNVLENRVSSVESEDCGGDAESLPNYTLVSGLPSYEEALEQLRQVRQMRSENKGSALPAVATADTQHQPPSTIKLSVAEFLQLYKSYPPL